MRGEIDFYSLIYRGVSILPHLYSTFPPSWNQHTVASCLTCILEKLCNKRWVEKGRLTKVIKRTQWLSSAPRSTFNTLTTILYWLSHLISISRLLSPLILPNETAPRIHGRDDNLCLIRVYPQHYYFIDERQHFRNCCNLILMLFVSNIIFIETETIQKRSVDSRTTQQIEKSTGRSICRIQMFYQNAETSVAEKALPFTFMCVILQHGYKRDRTLIVMPIHHLTLLHIYFLFVSIVTF